MSKKFTKGRKMKIKFYDNLDYQLDAINSITDILKVKKLLYLFLELGLRIL